MVMTAHFHGNRALPTYCSTGVIITVDQDGPPLCIISTVGMNRIVFSRLLVFALLQQGI